MRAGLTVGQTATVEFMVTADMFAQFEGKVVHPLLSTSSLLHQMEWAARKTILPYLEAHEEGMGSRVELHHLMLTPLGVNVTVCATVSGVERNKVECDVQAWHFRGKIARGTVVQAIIEKGWLQQKIKEIGVVEQIIDHQK